MKKGPFWGRGGQKAQPAAAAMFDKAFPAFEESLLMTGCRRAALVLTLACTRDEASSELALARGPLRQSRLRL